MPVFKSTRAIEEMQQRDGSSARYPHSSSRLKPLQRRGRYTGAQCERRGKVPHAQHVDEVLFRYVVLLVDVPLESGEDIPLLEQVIATFALEVQ